VTIAVGRDVRGGGVAGVRRVSGHHHTAQVNTMQQRPHLGDLVGAGGNPVLGDHDRLGMGQRGEQLDLAAFGAARLDRVADGLAVDGDRDQCVGLLAGVNLLAGRVPRDRAGPGFGPQPGADPPIRGIGVDAVRHTTDRGRTGDDVFAGPWVHATSRQGQQVGRQFRATVGDFPEVAGAGQHREHHDGQHRADLVADSPQLAGVGYAVEQVGQRADAGDTRLGMTGGRTARIRGVRH
jgi:hypothetical protein